MKHVLYFERKTRRPACVLLQAALGGDTGFLKQHIDSVMWTVSPEDLVPMTIDDTEAEKMKEQLTVLHEAGWPDLETLGEPG